MQRKKSLKLSHLLASSLGFRFTLWRVVCGLLCLIALTAGVGFWPGRTLPASAASQQAVAVSQDGQWQKVDDGFVRFQPSEPQPYDCITPEQRAKIAQRLAAREAEFGPVLPSADAALAPASPNVDPQPYPFYPMAGTLWQDIYPVNFVDLDPSGVVRTFDCNQRAYNGHTGHDVGFGGFREMAIGIPIFAALAGTVVDMHDGEPDMNTSCVGQANYVVLDHGNGHRTIYFHFKRNSILVSLNDAVQVGTQLGLTGSSGCSSAPHLHFESQLNNQVFEPFAGACRAGASNWVNQVVRQDGYVRDFYFSETSTNGETDTRIGSFAMQNSKLVHFRMTIGNHPAGTYRIKFRRPDSVTVIDSPGNFSQPGYGGVFAAGFFLDLNQLGTWRMLFEVNGQTLVDAPFEVVASAGQLVNRAPLPITASFDPPTGAVNSAIYCRVNTTLYHRDPDYNIMRYRYEWRVNGNLVRDVTSAVLSDAIPKGVAFVGNNLTCTVTPSDGITNGPPTTASMTVGEFYDVPSTHSFFTQISKLSSAGVTKGCAVGYFCPDANVTREQMAIFIERALGVFTPPTPSGQTFQDVPPGMLGYPFIEDFVARGITQGCAAGPPRRYCPTTPVTREQMAIFIERALGVFTPPTPSGQTFQDVPPGMLGYPFIEDFVARGITQGCAAGPPRRYCPTDLVTRAQMAVFLVRAFNL
jgi:murein DD-endopeptidase MepM/ murein hydrolase activator NlpD